MMMILSEMHYIHIFNAEAQNVAIWHLDSKASVPGPGPACRVRQTCRLTPREDRLVLMVPSTLRGMCSSICKGKKQRAESDVGMRIDPEPQKTSLCL